MSAQPTTELLAKARAAVVQDLKKDTGEARPRWRVIITDGESPTGVAPVCTAERGNALHMIDDYLGGPVRDEDGVYDCCPWPQFDTYSAPMAAYLVGLLNADAEEKASVPTPTATPGLTVYRASHDSIVLGHYTTAAEARKRCETVVRREHAETSTVKLWWHEDEDTVDKPEDGEQELWETVKSAVVPGPGLTRPTGYVVTPLEVDSEYDPEDDG